LWAKQQAALVTWGKQLQRICGLWTRSARHRLRSGPPWSKRVATDHHEQAPWRNAASSAPQALAPSAQTRPTDGSAWVSSPWLRTRHAAV